MSQIKPLKLLSNGDLSQVDTTSDDLTLNSFTGNKLEATNGATGEKLVVQANASDNEDKIFNVKNSAGVSVASIDEDGDMIVNDLTVNGVETVVGNIEAQSDLFLQGNFSVSGSVTLGNEATDALNFVGRAETDLNMNSNQINNLADPTLAQDAATKAYVDGEITTVNTSISNLSDGVMLLDGSNAMSSDMDLGGNKILSVGTPTLSGDAANKQYVDDQDASTLSSANSYTDGQISSVNSSVMLLDGSQAMTGSMDLGGNQINSLAAPTLSGDAATKAYVDDAVASVDLSTVMLLDGSQVMTGDMDLGGNQINSLATPTASGDAANKQYVDDGDASTLSSANSYTDGEIVTFSSTVMLLDGSQAMTGDMDLGGNKITSVGAPTASGDVTTKAYVDAEIAAIDVTGSTWSLSGNVLAGIETFGSTNDQNVTMIQNGTIVFELQNGQNVSSQSLSMSSNQINNLADPTLAQDAATKAYVDGEITTLSSAVMLLDGSQAMTADMDLGANKIVSLAEPTASGDAATKNYVDTQLAAGPYANQDLSNLTAPTAANQNLLADADSTRDLGSAAVKWDVLYVNSIGNDVDLGGNTITSVATPTASGDVANKQYVDDAVGSVDFSTVMLLDGSQAMTGAMDLGSQQINNLADPTLAQDAATKNYVDTNVMLLDGSNAMSSDMDLGGNKILSVGTPILSGDAANKQYVDDGDAYTLSSANSYTDGEIVTFSSTVMLLDGSQAMTGSMDLGGNQITSLAAPTASGDAATKAYVDSQISASTQAEDVALDFTASGAVAQGAPVFVVSSANNTVAEADASDIGSARLIGIAEEAITDTATGKITIVGFATIPTAQIDGGAFSIGAPVYLSETQGHLTSTAPSTPNSRVYQVGIATASDQLVIELKQGVTIT